MSTAQNTKSTEPAIAWTFAASATTRSPAAAGTGVASVHRLATASAYRFPAELGLAATAASSNHGWFSRRATNRCPTIPVAPRTPTLSRLVIDRNLAERSPCGVIRDRDDQRAMPLLDGLRVVHSK